MPGFLASGGEEFNLGPVTRLDHSEVLCDKVLVKYKRDRESFWHRNQKGTETVSPLLVYLLARCYIATAAAAKLLQSCPTLCNPIDGSPPGSSVPGILQQGYWSGLPFPSPMHACMLSCFSHV